MCLIGQGRDVGIKMLCDSMKFTDPGLDSSLRSRFHVPDDYIYWVMVFRKDFNPREDSSILRLSAEESRELSLEITASWHDSIRTMLERQESEATSTLVLHTCSTETFLTQWESLESPNTLDSGPVTLTEGPVTLLGDSAHPMTPVGGVGANTAFQEAADLCKAMVKVFGKSWKLTDAIMAYQGLMSERGKAVIGRSHMGGGHFFGMRPVDELKPAVFNAE
jgi:2-polyprenyl-6-methoxyphenol hydroxylase-like FAD-dependent oxidoreductase